MLIQTQITFTDEKESNLTGKDVSYNDDFVFDLSDVSGIMPGDSEGKTSIIFLHGRDILIQKPFKETYLLWKKSKGYEGSD